MTDYNPEAKRPTQTSQPVFPVCLMVTGERCVIVGGGKVATQKAAILLAAGAQVDVIASEPAAGIAKLADEGRVALHLREFSDADVDAARVVYAATNDRQVNGRVLAACRTRHVLCCAVDKGWVKGDFVTPAVFRKEALTVAVSTGGRSCRRSRLIRDSIARHVEMLESAELLVLGTSHDCLDLGERSAYQLAEERQREVGAMLSQVWGLHEFLLLNTCNRVEMHAVVTRDAAVENVLERIFGFDHLSPGGFYMKRGVDAFRHCAMLTAGLLSQTPGEKHVVAQMKEALEAGIQKGWAGPMMQNWLSTSLTVSKHIRRVTEPLLRNYETEDLCLAYLESVCPDLAARRVLVLGTGIIGRGCVEQLSQYGCRCDWLYHRNRPEVAADTAQRVRIHPLSALPERLAKADVVVCATSSAVPVLRPGQLADEAAARPGWMVDLSVPRNIAPEVDDLSDDIEVADLDDLKHWYRREAADPARIRELSETCIMDQLERYERLNRSFQGGNAQ